MPRNPLHCFVPPYLLARLAERVPEEAARLRASLAIDDGMRLRRSTTTVHEPPLAPITGPAWVVHTAENTGRLPGRPVRSAGDPESGDPAVDEAAHGLTGSLALFQEVYGRSSYDGNGVTVSATVHFEQQYANAFWDGTQLVFGDGDGRIFDRFTKPVDVLGHEFTHAVTEHTAGLVYQGQSGALNESVSDVFAACLKQRLRGQGVEEADWLVGEGLFLPGVRARALRDMARPGTAYDDPVLGRDPQPAHMDEFVETTDDNGGVHLNSGIPNRAFVLAAHAIGGSSWDGAGRVWFAALTSDTLRPRADFAAFAAVTVEVAGEHADAVRDAWRDVGVEPGESRGAPAPRPAPAGERVVAVRRSGGFAGLTVDGAVDLDSEDERAERLEPLVRRIDLQQLSPNEPRPDMYVYDFDLCGDCATLPENDLTPELRQVAEIVLPDHFR